MRLIKKGIAHRNGEGFVRLQADEAEDMYHLFNLICEGDIIGAETIRNVRRQSQCCLGGELEIFRIYLSARIYVFCKYLISWFQQMTRLLLGVNVVLNHYPYVII